MDRVKVSLNLLLVRGVTKARFEAACDGAIGVTGMIVSANGGGGDATSAL